MPAIKLFALGDKAGAKKLAKEVLAGSPQQDSREKLEHLVEICDEKIPELKPYEVPRSVKSVSISDLIWRNAKVGFRTPYRNAYRLEGPDDFKLFLEVDGKFFKKGLFAHSSSMYEYRLGGRWDTFQTKFGFRDGARNKAYFVIFGDGEELFRSQLVKPGAIHSASVSVKGVKELTLIVEKYETISRSWTVWVDPILTRD